MVLIFIPGMNTHKEARFVYITCKDQQEALQIGRNLVENRLAACANVLDSMKSLYWWDGKVVEDQECILIAKSTSSHMDALLAKVQELHSYELPCVVAMPITEGNPEYLQWIQSETT